MDVISYPCWDQNQSVLVKGAPGTSRSPLNSYVDYKFRMILYLNSLRAKHIFTFYVITPQWKDTGT